MTILDRYIIRQYAQSILFGLLAFISLFVLIDLIERLEQFVDRKASMLVIVEYYVYFLPEIIKLVMPMATLLAALFVTGRLTKQTELTAMKSGGISLYRILVPFYLVSLVFFGLDIWFSGWLVPQAGKWKMEFETVKLGRSSSTGNRSNITLQESPTRLVTIGYYDDDRRTAYNVSLQNFDGKALTSRFDAERMVYDTTNSRWVMETAFYRSLSGESDKLTQTPRIDTVQLSFTASDLKENNAELDLLTLPQHQRFLINREKGGFGELEEAWVKYHAKISFPFACLIVVLIGVPLSSVKKRSGVALEAGISLLLGFIYIGLQQTFSTLGYKGAVDPLLAAWLPNFLFLAVGVVLLVRVQK